MTFSAAKLLQVSAWLVGLVVTSAPGHAVDTEHLTDKASERELHLALKMGHSSSISALSISPNQKLLATGSQDRTARVWDMNTGAELRSLPHSHSVRSIAFLSDTSLAIGTLDGELHVWDLETGREVLGTKLGSSIEELLLAPDYMLWCATSLNGVFALDATTLQPRAPPFAGQGVAVSHPDGADDAYDFVVWQDKEATVFRWNGSVPAETITRAVDARITAGALSSDASTLLLGTEDGAVHQIDLRRRTLDEVPYLGQAFPISSIDVSHDGHRFASASRPGHSVIVRDIDSHLTIRTIQSDTELLSLVVFLQDGRSMIVATDAGDSARRVQLQAGADTIFRGRLLPVFSVEPSKSGRYLLTGTYDFANLWDLASGVLSGQFPSDSSARAVRLLPDENHVLTAQKNPYDPAYYLVARNVHTGRELGRVRHEAAIKAAAYSTDGTWLATGDQGGVIRLYDASNSNPIWAVDAHAGGVAALAFSPETGALLSYGLDRRAKVWDLETGRGRWSVESLSAGQDVFSPDGRFIAAWNGAELQIYAVATHARVADLIDAEANFSFGKETVAFVRRSEGLLRIWNAARPGSDVRVGSIEASRDTRIVPAGMDSFILCDGERARVVDLATATVRAVFHHAHCYEPAAPFILVEKDEKMEVWNAVSGRRQGIIPRWPSASLDPFYVSADGKYLVSPRHDFSTSLWDLSTGKSLREDRDSYLRFDRYRSALPALANDRDRYFVDSSTEEPPSVTISEWQIDGDASHRAIAVHPYAEDSLDVSPDGKNILDCGGDGVLRLYSRATGAKLAESDNGAPCSSAAFDPTGAFIWSTHTNDSTPILWAPNLEEAAVAFDYRPQHVVHFDTTDTGDVLVTDENDGKLRVWDTRSGKQSRSLSIGKDADVSAIAVVASNTLVLLASRKGAIGSRRLADGAVGPSFEGHDGEVVALIRSPANSRVFASAARDDTVRVWNTDKTRAVHVLAPEHGGTASIAFSSDGARLLTGGQDGTVQLWDLSSETVLATQKTQSAATAVGFGDDEDRVLIGSADGMFHLLDLRTGRMLLEFAASTAPIDLVRQGGSFIETASRTGLSVWSDDGQRITTFDAGAPLAATRIVWDAQTIWAAITAGEGVHIGRMGPMGFQSSELFSERVTSTAMSLNHRYVALGYSSGWVRVWDAKRQESVELLAGTADVDALAFSGDSSYLLSGAEAQPIELWDPSTGSLIKRYGGTTQADVRSVAFVGAGEKAIVAAAADGAVHVYARDSGEELCQLISGEQRQWLAVTPDGLFDGSPDTLTSVGWREGRSQAVIPLQSFYNDFFHPGLLAEIVARPDRPPRPEVDIATAIQVPGYRRMAATTPPEAHIEVRNGRYVVCFAHAPAVAIELAPGQDPIPFQSKDYEVVPTDGTCRFRKLLHGDRTQLMRLASAVASPKALEQRAPVSDASEATLHVLALGVTYDGTEYPELSYARASADAVSAAFVAAENEPSPYAAVKLWTAPETTDAAIRATFEALVKAVAPEDVVIIYLAGHGQAPLGQEMFYLVPTDATTLTLGERGISTAVLADVVRRLPAKRVLLILDTCQSGAAVEAIERIVSVKEAAAHAGKQTGTGMHTDDVGVDVVAAAMPLAYEIGASPTRSALAATLLQSLRHAHTVRQLVTQVAHDIPRTAASLGYEQIPLPVTHGVDFPLPTVLQRGSAP